jgi:hypothetical protein
MGLMSYYHNNISFYHHHFHKVNHKINGKIYLSLLNYYSFFIWAYELPSMTFGYVKLPTYDKKAPPSTSDVKLDGKVVTDNCFATSSQLSRYSRQGIKQHP